MSDIVYKKRIKVFVYMIMFNCFQFISTIKSTGKLGQYLERTITSLVKLVGT